MKFVLARQQGRSVIYTTDDGTEIKYSGGNIAWRTNNPGNLWAGAVSRRNNAIWKFDNFAVFPDYETGNFALIDSLKTTYGNKSLEQMIGGYAPSYENQTRRYLRFLRNKTGVHDNKKIKEFTPEQFEKLWQAIEQYEGQKKGQIEDVTPGRKPGEKRQITQVRKNKRGTIIAYNIEDIGWVSKNQGIELTLQGKVDAVVAASRSGNLYLRTRPSIEIVNLEDLG